MSEQHEGQFDPTNPHDDAHLKIIWDVLKATIAEDGPIPMGTTREIQASARVVYMGVGFQVEFVFRVRPNGPVRGPLDLPDTRVIVIDENDTGRMN